ncbi:MAG TPA: hypothetical protein DEG17_13760 [Cyanobacteria bacterium UBA11149]|nr:hypothetical protein [Cyanobacteria bacterium UBA11367]HBE57138.1 hypothetical protein [Cyanobacteria bacterium UBA11366]HBK62169.1 hypothetical protein [Cyanobacteria bacterium UBA11166]HBR75757.1 hypothetical protein [Cyanobacteria bacterium UBA11159]HBS69825.1 hypothetical protein [Cyanobacteria bacterium UBA11153]HBW89906.1 hypothetical protein [Cyanobacteria bacterium UBA11149]HCA96962.1 hypothetical protein [Cyanobacteria bacterium UBA9226]
MSLIIRHWLADCQIGRLGGITPVTNTAVSQTLANFTQPGYPNGQMAGIAFRIAQDMEAKSLTPFDISAIAEVLELPLVAGLPLLRVISQLTVGLLRILSRKKPLRRNEGTWLTFQVAYLNALQGILEQEFQLRRPWLNRATVPPTQEAQEILTEPQLIALIKTLRPGRLSDSQAEQALTLIADSLLVQQMNNIAIAWFVANGAEETEAKLLAQRLSNGLPGHLLTVIAENSLPLAQLQKFVRLGNVTTWRDTAPDVHHRQDLDFLPSNLPLDLDRERYRAGLSTVLSEPLFGEPFSLKDLYIPLKGRIVSEEGKCQGVEVGGKPDNLSSAKAPVDLMEWAISQLEDGSTIAVIEADAGFGKTSFCQIFANHVASELYPQWMPVLIRLRDVTLGQTLEQTLASAFPLARFTDTDGWLAPHAPPLLLILDGLNELPPSPPTERHLFTFIEQVMEFKRQLFALYGLTRCKIFLTSRTGTLDTLVTKDYRQKSTLPLSNQLRRIAIALMAQDEFRQWFQNWAKVQSKSIAQSYFTFLKHGGIFQKQPPNKEISTMISRPLKLYLLGILHRDARVDESIFQLSATQTKFEIYDRICRWLLGEAAPDSSPAAELIREGMAHASRSTEAIANLLDNRHPQELRHLMQTTALAILQTSRSSTPLPSHLSPFISGQYPLPALFFHCRQVKNHQQRLEAKDCGLVNAPASAPNQQSSIPTSYVASFSHPHLGEYLGAEEIIRQIKTLTKEVPDRYGAIHFVVESAVNVAQHLYALLGYGILSQHIEELTIEGLRREQKRNPDLFSFRVLSKRLYQFYRGWCQGRWIDEGIVSQAYQKYTDLDNPLNTLQIDAVVGINVFLLLCAAVREARVPFWPCGNPDLPQDFDPDRLLTFIGRTSVLSPTGFWQRLRHTFSHLHLARACLNRVMLAGVNLAQANLSAAELIGINLTNANLQGANFIWAKMNGANLSNADLYGANLEGADLSGANLRGANLTGANFTNTCLFEAQLDRESHNFAIRSGALFSLEEFQIYKESLVVPTLTSEDEVLLEEGPTIFIESAEGEAIAPEIQYSIGNDNYDGETAPAADWEYPKPAVTQEEEDMGGYAETAMLTETIDENL